MSLLLTFALLLQASCASGNLAFSDEQEADCSALSVSLLQTQVQLDHIQQIALGDETQVHVNSTSLADRIDLVVYGSSAPYSQSCSNLVRSPVPYTCSKYLTVLGASALFVVIGVFIVLRSQSAGGEQQLAKANPSEPLPSVALSPILLRFMGSVYVMVMVNQTIVMPASESKSEQVGQSVAFSGLLIGAYGLGVVLSFPFFLYCAYHSYKLGMLFVGVASVIGNIVYALVQSPNVVILTRIICGLEGGVIFMNQVIVQQLTQGDGLLKATAQVIMFPFVGLILGPVLSSMCQNFAPYAPPEVPPSVFMATCGAIFTVAVIALFPSREQCHAQARAAGLLEPGSQARAAGRLSPPSSQARAADPLSPGPQTSLKQSTSEPLFRALDSETDASTSQTLMGIKQDGEQQKEASPNMKSASALLAEEAAVKPKSAKEVAALLTMENATTRESLHHQYCCSLLSVVLLSAVNLSRMVQRLFWETSTLHLLISNYALGMGRAGALLTSSLFGLLALPLIVLPLKRNFGAVGGLRIMDLIEVVGILLQFRSASLHLDRLYTFMLGSALFYIGNMGQFNFLVPLRQELAVPHIWTLSIEGGVFIYSLFQSFGTFLGPVAARDIQSKCDGQNIIPAFLLITWFMNLLCKEISVDLLIRKK